VKTFDMTTTTNENRAALHALDVTISELAELRKLLSDPKIFMLAKQVFHAHSIRPSARTHPESPGATPHTGRVRAVFECVEQFGDELYSKHDIAERLRQAGYSIGNPKNQLKFAINSLVAEGRIKLVQPHVGPRPSLYQNIACARTTTAAMPMADKNQDVPSTAIGAATTLAKQLPLHDKMLHAALHCIEGLDQPFRAEDVVSGMKTAGYTFVGDPNLSIQSPLTKLLNRGIIEIYEEPSGEKPTTYMRSTNMWKSGGQRF
jgi:hypothetical protein